MKIAVIGAGNLGSAIIEGLLSHGVVNPNNFYIIDKNPLHLNKFSTCQIFSDLKTCSTKFDVLILSLKPDVILSVVPTLLPFLHKDTILVSTAAGIEISTLSAAVPEKQPIVRTMLNIAASVGCSTVFYTPSNCSDTHNTLFIKLFSCLGLLLPIAEQLMAAGTALSGCGLAYVLRYIRATVTGGVEIGFSSPDALKIVLQTIKGAIELISNSSEKHVESLIDQITTPGGLTIKGLNKMEECGFNNSVIQGIKSGYKG